MMRAWSAYKATPEYANSRSWAKHSEHVDGSLWASFMAGWEACGGEQLRAELAASREREARMRDALIVVRHHPAFDDGGPMAEMMDQVTGGQPAPLLEKIAEFAALAEGAQG